MGILKRLKIIYVLLLAMFTAIPLWSTDWLAAPASASESLSEGKEKPFSPLKNGEDLESLLIGTEGWFWLKTTIRTSDGPALLFDGTQLYWKAWIGDTYLGESGSPPPYWLPSSASTETYPLPAVSGGTEDIWIKAYVRRGYGDLPHSVHVDNAKQLSTKRINANLRRIAVPVFVVILGVLLFIGGMAAFVSSRKAWDGAMALFGLFMAVAFSESILAQIPGMTLLIPWIVPSLAVKAAVPLALSAWRRCVGSAGKRDPWVLSVLDILASVITAVWILIPMLQSQAIPNYLHRLAIYDPLPYYIGWSVLWALSIWIARTVAGRDGRLGSLMVFLAALGGTIPILLQSITINGFVDAFLNTGLPAALIAAMIVMMARKRVSVGSARPRSDTESSKTKSVQSLSPLSEDNEEDDDIADLESFDDFPVPAAEDPITFDTAAVDTGENSMLIESLRATLYPEALPWDPNWDIGSARQGSAHPATGFHDVYRDAERRLSGFSFMDAGIDTMEAVIFAHLVKSEIGRLYTPERSLAKICRSVHRKSTSAAKASGKGMVGVVGRLFADRVAFVPLSLPPLILKRASGEVISLQPVSGGASNPPVGLQGFGAKGLKSLSIKMGPGDCLLAYTPSILEIHGLTGESWGRKGLARALKNSEGLKSELIVADIVEELKDFAGTDKIENPLQILVIRHR